MRSTDARRAGKGQRQLRHAWWSLGLFVPSLLAAFLVGEGLAAALGFDGEGDVPVHVALAAGLPAVAAFALPTLLVWHLGRRAQRAGAQDAWIPAVVALAISGLFLAVNLFQLAVLLLLG